jgi:hypothetical protein
MMKLIQFESLIGEVNLLMVKRGLQNCSVFGINYIFQRGVTTGYTAEDRINIPGFPGSISYIA